MDAKPADHESTLMKVVAATKGDSKNGRAVFVRVRAACHQHGTQGNKFGPELTQLGDRLTNEHIIRSIVWPNDKISQGYETVLVLDYDGISTSGFILSENDDKITLGIAKGKTKVILKDDIEFRKDMKASSMPEGLIETIAPKEFLDLLAFLMGDWIATNPNLDYKLQAFGGMKEVSRQTHVRIAKTSQRN